MMIRAIGLAVLLLLKIKGISGANSLDNPLIPTHKMATPFCVFIAIATCIRTNQNPNSVRRRFAPPHTIWVLCPNKNGDSYKNQTQTCKVATLRGATLRVWVIYNLGGNQLF